MTYIWNEVPTLSTTIFLPKILSQKLHTKCSLYYNILLLLCIFFCNTSLSFPTMIKTFKYLNSSSKIALKICEKSLIFKNQIKNDNYIIANYVIMILLNSFYMLKWNIIKTSKASFYKTISLDDKENNKNKLNLKG